MISRISSADATVSFVSCYCCGTGILNLENLYDVSVTTNDGNAIELILLAILFDYGYNLKKKRGKLVRLMKTLSVEEIKTRMNEGATDDELMQDYGLTPEQLKEFFDQLMTAMAQGSPYVSIADKTA
jgi:hypothetical protein